MLDSVVILSSEEKKEFAVELVGWATCSRPSLVELSKPQWDSSVLTDSVGLYVHIDDLPAVERRLQRPSLPAGGPPPPPLSSIPSPSAAAVQALAHMLVKTHPLNSIPGRDL